MTHPDGLKVVGKENWVYKLKKLLYEVKQSPRHWCKQLNNL